MSQYDAHPFRLLGDPAGDLGDGAHSSSFSEVLKHAIREGTPQQNDALFVLRTTEAPEPPVVDVHRAEIVTQTASGLVIRDKRRVRVR